MFTASRSIFDRSSTLLRTARFSSKPFTSRHSATFIYSPGLSLFKGSKVNLKASTVEVQPASYHLLQLSNPNFSKVKLRLTSGSISLFATVTPVLSKIKRVKPTNISLFRPSVGNIKLEVLKLGVGGVDLLESIPPVYFSKEQIVEVVPKDFFKISKPTYRTNLKVKPPSLQLFRSEQVSFKAEIDVKPATKDLINLNVPTVKLNLNIGAPQLSLFVDNFTFFGLTLKVTAPELTLTTLEPPVLIPELTVKSESDLKLLRIDPPFFTALEPPLPTALVAYPLDTFSCEPPVINKSGIKFVAPHISLFSAGEVKSTYVDTDRYIVAPNLTLSPSYIAPTLKASYKVVPDTLSLVKFETASFVNPHTTVRVGGNDLLKVTLPEFNLNNRSVIPTSANLFKKGEVKFITYEFNVAEVNSEFIGRASGFIEIIKHTKSL